MICHIFSAGAFYQETFRDDFRVSLSYTGKVSWSFGGLFETTCHIDTDLYPYDSHSCSIVFENWAYDMETVQLESASDEIEMELFQENGIWKYTDTFVYTIQRESQGKLYPQIAFTVTWQRKPLYYMVNIMTPIILVLIISLLVFWLPPGAGQKVSLAVTVLLAFSVFQVIIADHTPRNSVDIPLFSKYIS